LSRAKLCVPAVLALTGVALLPASTGAATDTVKAPKNGATYSGMTAEKLRVSLRIQGKAIEVLAVKFNCKGTIGRTSFSAIPLRKTRRGYAFGIMMYGIVTYEDPERTDENAQVRVSGRFGAETARRVTGKISLKTPECGTTKTMEWHARR
jgi:hypothetical protein